MILVAKTDFIGQYQLARSISEDLIIQSYIDREEKKTLYRLLGKELADLLIAYVALPPAITTSGFLVAGVTYKITTYVAGDDFTNVGATLNESGISFVASGTTPAVWTNASTITNHIERYDNLLDPFYLESSEYCSDGSKFYDSKGIKDLLLIQIYYAYITETQLRPGQSGVAKAQAENATVSSVANAFRMGEIRWNTAGLSTWEAIRWYCKVKYPEVYQEYNGVIERARYSSLI